MARPMKQTVEYFPHYVSPGKTLFILESRWASIGYAFWFKMLEVLGESDGHVLHYNEPDSRDYFLARVGIQHTEAVQIFTKLVELRKIDRELWNQREWVWCPSFIENLKAVYSKRTTPIPQKPEIVFGEKTGFSGRKQHSLPMKEIVFGEKTPLSRVEERKEEGRASCDILIDSDKDKNKDNKAPTLLEVFDLVEKEKLTLDAEDFFNHYEALGWKVNGQSISKWPAVARRWSKENKERGIGQAASAGFDCRPWHRDEKTGEIIND